jgi:Prenyltransferase and squalene oxidase repeat
MEKATDWLISIQDKTGGWGQYQGASPNVLNTAESILAMLDTKQCKAGDDTIQKGIDYLKFSQLVGNRAPHRTDEGAWGRLIPGDDGPDRHLPETVRSAFALLALNASGEPTHDPSVSKGLHWLVRTSNADGGWGYTAGHESSLFPSCMALCVLLRLHDAGDKALKDKLREPIEKGLTHLHDAYRNPLGSFGRQADLVAAHTLYALRTLRLARDQGFRVERRDIEDAVGWIGGQGPCVTQWVNEFIKIGDKDPPYAFTHVTPALYLDTFGADLSANDAIARESMIVMHGDMDRVSCGFSGRRPVSWATAKSLIGLAAVHGIFHAFPEREIPTGQVQGRQYLFLLLVSICVLATVVALSGKLSSEYVGVMGLVILACLLIYGYITERSFIEVLLARKWLQKRLDK